MSRKMQINRLDKDELVYELVVRGIGTGTVDEMRRRLSQAIQLEKEGDSIKYPPYPFSFDEDCEEVEKKLEDLKVMVENFENGQSSNEAIKLHTKLSFTLGRINNMVCEAPGAQEKKAELVAIVLSLMEDFTGRIEEYEKKKGQVVLPALSFVEGQVGESNFHQQLGQASTPTYDNKNSYKTIPPHKWNIQKFSGDKKSNMSINTFFEHVEELRVARNVSKETLLNAGIDLFGDKAYQFYKDCRGRVSTWEELVREFKGEFLSANYEDDLFEELRKRTQHSTEAIGVYLAIMGSYFNRLKCQLSEEVKLKIILKNLHPYYQERLPDPMPTSLDELRIACRNMEARRDVIRNYVEPCSRRNYALEKDLAYIGTSENLEAVEPSPCSSTTNANSSTKTIKTIICYRCKQPGHKAIGCALPKQLKCFRCGKEGYTVRNCPSCSQSGNANRRT